MTRIAYHASHEQFAPSELLRYCQLAEQAGFQAINSSDHIKPWNDQQGESGFSFAWLGAAMQATRLPFGMVCAPGQRYHPAIVAQAFATLGELFPGRFWAALGSGEAVNEKITGDPWPPKAERNARLLECYQSIKQLLRGETVNIDSHIRMRDAKLYTLPKEEPLLVGAAVTRETAEWMGGWADGIITVNKPYDELKEFINAFRQAGGERKPMIIKTQLSYAPSKEQAEQEAYEQWKTNILHSSLLADIDSVEDFEKIAANVEPDDLHGSVRISADLDEHRHWIEQDIALGFSTIVLHNVNLRQELFIRDFGKIIRDFA
jgi:coenzyme F420-dependent glucose-6-phosphate dehydrogenase